MAVKGEKIGQLQGIFWSVVSKQAYSYTVIQLYSAKSRTAWKIPPTPPKRFSGEVAGHPWNLFCSFLFFSALFLPLFSLSSSSSSSSLPSSILLFLLTPPGLFLHPLCVSFLLRSSFSLSCKYTSLFSDNPTLCGF